MVDCTICFDKLSQDNTITKCAHTFHTECQNMWLLYNNICPYCRTNNPLEIYVPLQYWFTQEATLAIPLVAIPRL